MTVSTLYNLIDTSDDTACVIVVRNREMQGVDTEGLGVDSVEINGNEVCAGVLPGGTTVNNSGPIGLVVFDEDADGVTDLSGVSNAFSSIPFVYGADLVIPGTPAADGIIKVVIKDRYSRKTQTINLPNWDSTVHKMFVQFIPL